MSQEYKTGKKGGGTCNKTKVSQMKEIQKTKRKQNIQRIKNEKLHISDPYHAYMTPFYYAELMENKVDSPKSVIKTLHNITKGEAR